VTGVPAKILFHQVFGTADTITNFKGNSNFGLMLGSGIDGVIHVPATAITLGGTPSSPAVSK